MESNAGKVDARECPPTVILDLPTQEYREYRQGCRRTQPDPSDNLVTYHCGAPVALRNGAQAEAGPRLGGGPTAAPTAVLDLLRNLSTASVRPTMEFSRLLSTTILMALLEECNLDASNIVPAYST